MAFLPGVFGGDNTVGFFGGGRYRPDQANFQDDQYGGMNARYQQGADRNSDVLNPNDPNNPYAQQNQARAQQQQLAGNLFGTLNGTGPSVAQQQLQQTTQGNVANAFALAQSGRYNPGASRMALNQGAMANQQAAGQGALLRAQEVQNAQGQLGGVLGGMRQQDQGIYNAANQNSLGYLGGQQQLGASRQAGNIAFEGAQQQGFQGAQQNAVGGKILNAAAGIGAAFAGKAHGGEIPGKAHGGDLSANDSVPIMASPGEIVLPRSITMHDDAPELAKAFVAAIHRQRMGHNARKAA